MNSAPSKPDASLKKIATLVYVLQAATYGLLITFFIAPLVIYWKRQAVRGTWVESHLRWQLNSFWFGLAGVGLGLATFSTPLGVFFLAATNIWLVFRIGQGWTRLSRGQTMGDKRL